MLLATSETTVNLMVDLLSPVYGALSSEVRREIVSRLVEHPAAINDLRQGLDFTKQAMTKHVRQLETAGLVTRTTVGRTHVLTLVADPLDDAAAWLAGIRDRWDVTFDALEDYLR